jgi:hypothetical protein
MTQDLQIEAPASGARLPARIAHTFASPRRLAEAVRERPRWLDVLLISTAVAIVAVALMPPEPFLEAARNAVDRRGTPVEITSSPEEIVRWGRYLGMLSALVGHPMIAFSLAGLLTLVFTLVPRGSIRFVEHLSLVSHALLILALGDLVVIAFRAGTGGSGDPLSLAPLGGLFAADSLPREVLTLINPFHLWILVVLAVGIATLDARRARSSSLAILIGGYLALALVTALST